MSYLAGAMSFSYNSRIDINFIVFTLTIWTPQLLTILKFEKEQYTENCWFVANSADTDETPHYGESHLNLRCLLKPVCLSTYDKQFLSKKCWWILGQFVHLCCLIMKFVVHNKMYIQVILFQSFK